MVNSVENGVGEPSSNSDEDSLCLHDLGKDINLSLLSLSMDCNDWAL